jgi:hypothetical protein
MYLFVETSLTKLQPRRCALHSARVENSDAPRGWGWHTPLVSPTLSGKEKICEHGDMDFALIRADLSFKSNLFFLNARAYLSHALRASLRHVLGSLLEI